MNFLCPSSTYASPSRRAVVEMAATSLPASGSVSANANSTLPDATLRSRSDRCASLPASTSGWLPSPCTANSESAAALRAASSSRSTQMLRTSAFASAPPYADGTRYGYQPSAATLDASVASSIAPSSDAASTFAFFASAACSAPSMVSAP
jgi:hypothetical protein